MTENRPALFGGSPLLSALGAQVLGTLLAAVLFYTTIPEVLYQPLLAATIQGACAAIASNRLRAPTWWQAIHLIFAPCLWLAFLLQWPPAAWLSAFVVVLLIFWRTDKSRVPLYLTNHSTARAVLTLLPSGTQFVLDVGCGDGGLLRRLARSRPDCEFVGIEHAPLTWLWARLASGRQSNVHIRYGDFWRQPLTPFDVVYAFLSPAPMSALWNKAQIEMRPDTLLVSNSFDIPDVTPNQTIDVDDRRASRLLCYRMCGQNGDESMKSES